jgi:serine/threonine-protein kinase
MGSPRLTKIGKYEVLEIVGRGGMGVVYKAVDPAIGRLVAIKMVTGGFGDDPDLLKRFYREAKSTGSLQHPNIVTVYDLGDQEGVPYLVMEFLEGESLEAVIRSRHEMVIAEKLSLLVQVCDGLDYAHRRNVIHRDIKPANIVVTKDSGIKIVDFGIARFGNERFTKTGQVMGSINYMSPEQINGEDTDARTDIYSTGIVLFEFLTGELPFRGKDTSSTLMKILHDPIPPLSLFLRSYPIELDQVVARALAKKRDDRYASIEDFAFDIQRIQEESRRQLIVGYLHTAEACVAQSDWNKAKENLRQVLKLDRQHTRANELVREIQVQLQKQQKRDQLRQLRARAEEALGQREWDDALTYLDQAIELDRTNAELIELRDSVRQSKNLLNDALHRAEAANQAGELEAAKKAVEEALAVDSSDSRARALKAIVSKELADRSKRRAVEALLNDARKEVSGRRFTAALELLKKAQELDPGAADVQQMIGFATTAREQEKRKQALEQASAEIEDLLNRDEYGAACSKADEALAKFPQDAGLIRLRAFAEKQREAWKKRLYVESQLDVAHRLLDQGDSHRASGVLQEALKKYPDDPSLLSLSTIVNEAVVREQNQRQEEERRKVEAAADIRAQLAAAQKLLDQGKVQGALKIVEDALVRHPEQPELRALAISAREKLTREEAERDALEKKARRERAAIIGELKVADQLLNSQNTAKAIATLEEALRRYPESRELQDLMSKAKEQLARGQGAEEKRRKSVEAEVQKARALLEQDHPAEAANQLEAALQKLGDDAAMRSLLGKARDAAKRQQAEQGRKAEEQKRLEEFNRERARDLAELKALAQSNRQQTSFGELTSLSDRVQELARKYGSDPEVQAAASQGSKVLGSAITMLQEAGQIKPSRSGATPTKIYPQAGNASVLEPPPLPGQTIHATSVDATSTWDPQTELQAEKAPVGSRSTLWIAVAVVAVLAVAAWLIRANWPAAKSVVVIETQPQGASVKIGARSCITPDCRLQLSPGNYELHAQLEGYQDASQSVTVAPGQPESTVSLNLEPVTKTTGGPSNVTPVVPPPIATSSQGTLVVRTGLPDVEILINGKKQGQTSPEGVLRLPLDPREYSVMAQKSGFVSAFEQSVRVSKGREATISLEMRRMAKSAFLSMTGVVPGAQVLANSQPLGTVGTDGSFSRTLDIGDYEIVLTKDGQNSVAIHKHLRAGDTLNLSGSDFKFPTTVATHSVQPPANPPATAVPGGSTPVVVPPTKPSTSTTLPAPSTKLRVSSQNIRQGESATLIWETQNATDVSIEGLGSLPASGSRAVSPSASTTYRMTARGPGGTTTESFPPITVSPPPATASQPSNAPPSLFEHDRESVKQALDRWKSAYESESLDDMKKAWPGISRDQLKKLKDTFNTFNAIKVIINYQDKDIRITGNSAEVACLQSMRYTLKGKVQPDQVNAVSIKLSKQSDGTWAVASVSGS